MTYQCQSTACPGHLNSPSKRIEASGKHDYPFRSMKWPVFLIAKLEILLLSRALTVQWDERERIFVI
jgi:hypothetical protein